MEITTPDLLGKVPPGSLPKSAVDPTRVKFEVVNNYAEPPKPKSSFFGGFLRVLGALAMPAAFIPGVGPMIAGAGVGASMFGGHLQNKAAQYNSENASKFQAKPVSYPGVSSASFASYPELDMISAAHYDVIGSQIQGVK